MEQDWNWCSLIELLRQVENCIQFDVHDPRAAVYSLSYMDKESKKLKLDITLSKSTLLLQDQLNSAPLRHRCSGTLLTGRQAHTLNSLVRYYDIYRKNNSKIIE
jgi:hypothetical protein